MKIKKYIEKSVAKAAGKPVMEGAAEKLVYPNVSEILDINEVFKNVSSGFLRISKNISKLSGILKSKTILSSLVLEDEDDNDKINIVNELLNVQLVADLEFVFHNIYEMQAVIAIKKNGIAFKYNLAELNMTIENAKANMTIINNNVSRLTSLPWWNTLQQSDFQKNTEFRIQVIYCGIADACTRFLESVKKFKDFEGDKIALNEKDLPVLNLAPPLVQDAAKAYYDKNFLERIKARIKIIAHMNKLQEDFKSRGIEGIFKDFNINNIFN